MEKLFEATKPMHCGQQKEDNVMSDEPNYHLVHFSA